MPASELELTSPSSQVTVTAVGRDRTRVVRVRSPLPWCAYGLVLVAGWLLASLVVVTGLSLLPGGVAAMLAVFGVVPALLYLPVPLARRAVCALLARHPWLGGTVELSVSAPGTRRQVTGSQVAPRRN
jgi:hypothetical protein